MTSARAWRGAVVVLAAALALGACTSDRADPDRAGTVVVAVDTPFGSLNAGLPDGRTAGSTLVRGLVQNGLVGLDDAGQAVPDTAFGTVEKVSDAPLTVRYTLAADARWSDGVPVSPADLLLEWAARSGRFDEAVPGQVPAASPAPRPTTSSPPTAAASTPAADDTVRFGATSAAVLEAGAIPTLDEHGLTVVYDRPVADWQVDLDVDLPAHVVGRLALVGAPTPATSQAAAPGPSASGSRWADDEWAQAVAEAIVGGDHASLARISQVWRTGFDAAALAADPARAVTTGPYRIASVDASGSVTLVRSTEYVGTRPGTYDRVVVRWDLDPLAAVDALRTGDVDVVAPVVTPDVTAALARVPDVRVATGGGAVLQLQLNEAKGPFSASQYSGDDAAATAAGVRAAFLAAVPRADLAAAAGADASDAVLATAGAGRTTSPVASSGTVVPKVAGTVTVRVLVATGDPVRAAILDALTAAASAAGFAVTTAGPTDPSTALWDDPGSWDAALLPVTQAELPVAGVADRWRTGGATNVTGHADPALDTLLAQATGTADPAAAGDLLDQVGVAVRDAQVVVPLVRQPAVTATVARAAGSGLPDVGEVGAVPWGSSDLSSWWLWARQDG